MVVRRAEEEDEGGPEGAEGGEDQAADGGRFDQQRLRPHERPERAERVTVGHGRPRRQQRQGSAQQERQGNGENRGDEKDGAPVEPFCDPSGEGAAEQYAEQEAGHDGADGAPCVGGSGDLGRDGQQDMGDGSHRAGEDGDKHHGQQRGHDGSDEHRQDEAGNHFQDEAAALEDIAERHEEEKSDGVSGLGGDGDVAHLCLGDVEAASHLDEQGLVEVEGRDGDAGGEAEQRNQPLARSACRRGGLLLCLRAGKGGFHMLSMLPGTLRLPGIGSQPTC
jgi:hypothetical protein